MANFLSLYKSLIMLLDIITPPPAPNPCIKRDIKNWLISLLKYAAKLAAAAIIVPNITIGFLPI